MIIILAAVALFLILLSSLLGSVTSAAAPVLRAARFAGYALVRGRRPARDDLQPTDWGV